MRAVAEDGIGLALAVFIERRRRRIECFLNLGDEAGLVERQLVQTDTPAAAGAFDDDRGAVETDRRVLAGVGETKDLSAHRFAGEPRRLAGDESLARR